MCSKLEVISSVPLTAEDLKEIYDNKKPKKRKKKEVFDFSLLSKIKKKKNE